MGIVHQVININSMITMMKSETEILFVLKAFGN